jgi:glycosyltransferase involved in cell wall biosynthesis
LDDIKKQNVELILVGSGPLEEDLKTLSNSLECSDAVRFISWIEQKDLYDIYESSSAMLIPSQEGAGAVVAEGMSFGLPIICFDNFGAGELVNGNCGFIVPNNLSYIESFKKMGDYLNELYSNRSLLTKMSEVSIKNFKENLTWDVKGDQLLSIYNQFLNKN